MAITQNASFENRTPHADFYYSCQPNSSNPWPSVSAAHAGITPAYRSGGKIIFVIIDGEVIPHMYQGGVAEINLLPLPSGKSAQSSNAITKTSIENLRLGKVTDPVVYITNAKKEGFFRYDPLDTTSGDDGALVVLAASDTTKRYKRLHNGVFYPNWWGMDETGTTSVGPALNTMFTAALANSADVEANGTYLIDEPYPNAFPFFISIKTNLRGRGLFKTRNNATLNVTSHGISIEGISIDGMNGSTVVGRGLYNINCSNITVTNVKITNVISQGIWFHNGDNIKIQNCTTRNTLGIGGDGIYVSQGSNIQISNNFCSEFQRIGIACEGTDTGFDYTKNAVVTGNIVLNAIPSELESANYPNGGIWLENIAGCIVSDNRVENTYFRGISVVPSLSSTNIKYTNIISNNTIKNCKRVSLSTVGPAYGIVNVYGDYTASIIDNNIITDCERFIGIGGQDDIIISNCIFNLDQYLPNDVSLLISVDFIRTTDVNRRTKVVIENCVNNTGTSSGKGISIPNVNNQRGDLEVRNCKGDFSYIMGNQVVNGNFKFVNCEFDYTTLAGSNIIAHYVTGKVVYQGCTIKLGVSLFPYSEELEFNNTKCYADTETYWTLFDFGSRVIKILNNSEFVNVHFFNLRRPNHEIILKNSTFDGYPASQGLFRNTIALVSKLDVDGCRFSKTNTTTVPLSFAAGATEILFGENFCATEALCNIPGTTNFKQHRNFTYGTAQRPTTPQLSHLHFDPTTLKWERWNGVVWDKSTSYTIVDSVIAPTKAGLNTTYGSQRAGSQVYYPNQTGGARIYLKLAEDNTGDWHTITPALLA